MGLYRSLGALVCCPGPSNKLKQQIEPNRNSWQYPLINYSVTVETNNSVGAVGRLGAPALAASTLTSAVSLHNSPLPSAASSTVTSVLAMGASHSTSPSPPASTLLMTASMASMSSLHSHHPLDSLLTPAASPEEDPLETWIHNV